MQHNYIVSYTCMYTNEVHVGSTVHSVPVPGRFGWPVGPTLVVLGSQNNVPG